MNVCFLRNTFTASMMWNTTYSHCFSRGNLQRNIGRYYESCAFHTAHISGLETQDNIVTPCLRCVISVCFNGVSKIYYLQQCLSTSESCVEIRETKPRMHVRGRYSPSQNTSQGLLRNSSTSDTSKLCVSGEWNGVLPL